MASNPTPVRRRNCGECARFWRDPDEPRRGYCDNWAGIHLRETDVCNPNFGVKKTKTKGQT